MCVYFGSEFAGSHRRLRTPSDTFVNFYRWIHMSDQEIKFGYFTLGGDMPHLAAPNTHDLSLLMFYPTVSLDFGRCPISSSPHIHQGW